MSVGTYHVIMTCRNSEKFLGAAILSIINQSIKPEYVIIIDDGSTDNTPAILKEIKSRYRNVSIITNPDFGYDIGRVVFSWNKAIKLAKELNLPKTDYHMISSDDVRYEFEYAEKILKYMDSDPLITIASGEYNNDNSSKPRGSGRFIRNSFLFSVHGYYPERVGYESAILYSALKNRLKYLVIPEAHYVHSRQLGVNHHFHDWGQSMRSLGYHPIFAFSRFVKYFLLGRPIGRLGALRMFYYYLSFKPKDEGYYSMYDSELRRFVRLMQLKRIKGYIGL